MDEFGYKINRIQDLLDAQNLDALLLQRVSSFAWATCGGASYVNSATTNGTSSLLFTRDSHHLITNNIEAPRLQQEEGLADQNWTIQAPEWHEPHTLIADLTQGMKLGADGPYPGAVDVSGPVTRLCTYLIEPEIERLRRLGGICAAAMDEAIAAVRPGQSEYEIAAILGQACQKRGAQPIVNLIATDENVYRYRHPLPTDKQMEAYAMLVLCGRKWGLVCSITRLVHFGTLPGELRNKMQAVASIDATYLAATRPGVPLNRIFQRATEAYAASGYADEWRLHHQGGPTGYESRAFLATPQRTEPVVAGQGYAWNPSVTGTKSEDTILVGEEGNEVLTVVEGWPTIAVSIDGETYQRPAILEIV